jgi:hypothetical protein
MNLELVILFGVLQIVLQAVAAYFSYRIFAFNRVRKWWLAVTWALILMTFRRITALLIELKWLVSFSGSISDIDRIILPFLISVLLLWGIYAMFRNFEEFDVVEKVVKSKVSRRRNG